MSVIIRLQNLPWSANALDIRNFFRGLSIPEGGVHIVGGELGDAFIAFSTDEDARQAMMLDCGKIKEIQVKLLLSSRSEMHKVIETARQSVPILTLTAPAAAPTPPAPAPPPAPLPPPALAPFATALGANNSLSNLGIPGLGNPLEIPQPAVIEPPSRISISPPLIITPNEKDPERDEDDRVERKRSREKERRRSKSRSRSRERKDRKRERRDRDRSRSRERRRRDRSRSRDRSERKRDRRNRSRSRERSPSRHSRDRRAENRRSPSNLELVLPQRPGLIGEPPAPPPPPAINNPMRSNFPVMQPNMLQQAMQMGNGPNQPAAEETDRFPADIANRLQELSKKRNPSVFQGDQNAGNGLGGGPPSRFHNGGPRGGGMMRGGRRDAPRGSRFEPERDCCLAIRNAPNHTSYGDVRRFFPFMIDKHGIKMINDQTGRRTGNIYVRFCEPRSKQLSLQRRNNELKGQEVIVEHLDDDVYDSAVDSFLPFRDDNADQPITIPDPEPVQQVYTVIRIADLPNFVQEQDIIKSFSDFSLLSIMLNDCRNTRTKTAYVQFVKPEDARQAFERRERLVFGRRNPTVTSVTDEEYEQVKIQQNTEPKPEIPLISPPVESPPHREPSPAVPRDPRQRRAEPQQPQAQPQAFFPNAFIQQQGFPAPPFGGFPGAGGALVPRAAIIDPRAGPLDTAPMDPRGAAWGAHRPNFPNMMQQNGDNVRQNIEDEPLDCVLMKGLPRDATDRTIVDFLADTGAVPARIHLMLDHSGMPSGDCFCEFRSPGEASRAATKHAHELDGCRVTVDLVMRSVVEDALEGPKNMDRDIGFMGDPLMQQAFFDHPRGGFNPRGGFRGRGGFDRGGFNPSFDRGRGFDRSRGRGGFDRGGRGGFDRGGRGFERGRGRGFGRGRGGFDNERAFDDRRELRMEEPDLGLEDFGAPGCVVTLENVPFRATVEDIMQFFSEFELTQDDVIRRFNERGQATGDARVSFRTPFDAQRACKTHHLEMILDRRISLNIL